MRNDRCRDQQPERNHRPERVSPRPRRQAQAGNRHPSGPHNGPTKQGRAIYENGGLNLANLTDEQQIEAEDDYCICVRRGGDEKATPDRSAAQEKPDDDEEEES